MPKYERYPGEPKAEAEARIRKNIVKKKKQGYYDKEDESLGMSKGALKSKKAKKVRRDESYGKWGKRKTDWSNHQKG